MKTPNLAAVLALFFCAQNNRGADPLQTWSWRNPVPTGNRLEAIAFANDQFIAVGFGGAAVTSGDGINWVQRQTSTRYTLTGVTYGNGRYVAVGHTCGAGCDGTIVSSEDGVNWVEHHPTPPVWGYLAVAYGDGQFVAVGNAILTSPDGITWTQRPFPKPDYALTGIVYANGQFVAVGDNERIATSADGVKWVLHQSASSGDLPAIAYGNGQFVAPVFGTGLARSSIVTSTDGVTWVKSWSAPQNQFAQPIGVGFGNGIWVVVGAAQSGLLILTSSDGVNWVQQHAETETPNWTNFLSDVAYGNGQFVAVGAGGIMLSSTDGITWVNRQSGPRTDLRGIAYGQGQFVAVGGTPHFNIAASPETGTLLTSPDGASWISRETGTKSFLNAVAFGNGQFVAIGNGGQGGLTLNSFDAVNWVLHQARTDARFATIAYLNGHFVVLGEGGDILFSSDGVNWVQHRSGVQDDLRGIAYGNGQYVAVGPTGKIITSADGSNWVNQEGWPQDNEQFGGIIFGNGLFVASSYNGYNGKFLVSADGVIWRMSRAEGIFSGITYANGQFVAVGGGPEANAGAIFTSTDGTSWRRRRSGDDLLGPNWLKSVTYGNGHFVAVGYPGTILQSGSIINLEVRRNSDTRLLSLSLEAPSGLDYTIQTSSDLIFWRDVTKINNAQSSKLILDGLPVTSERQFYRAFSH